MSAIEALHLHSRAFHQWNESLKSIPILREPRTDPKRVRTEHRASKPADRRQGTPEARA